MLAARLLCAGERPESLQSLFQAACLSRFWANGEKTLLDLPFILRNLPGATIACQDANSQLYIRQSRRANNQPDPGT